MRCAATTAVDPPTLPAVCTRMIGLPAAPSASARYSSGIITPSKMSGAVPMTTASTSPHVISASSSARTAASRTSPASDKSSRHFDIFVNPTPTTAQGSAIPTLQHAHEVLLQARARRRVAEHPAAAPCDLLERFADAHEPGDHHRVGRDAAARRVDL